jgi:hypothetical protein
MGLLSMDRRSVTKSSTRGDESVFELDTGKSCQAKIYKGLVEPEIFGKSLHVSPEV